MTATLKNTSETNNNNSAFILINIACQRGLNSWIDLISELNLKQQYINTVH